MKPRIFIAIHYLELGGAETSLIGLLHAFDPEKVDVDLLVYSHQGELMKAIPPHVNLLPENRTWSMFEKPLKEVLKAGQLRMFLARMNGKCQMKEYVKSMQPSDGSAIFGFLGKEVSKVLPDINPDVEYDLAISYLHPHDFVLDHVRAKKKLCWIHTDYSTIDVNTELELPVWGAYNHIVSISADCTKSFLQKFPTLASKIIDMENIMPVTMIRSRADEFEVDWDKEEQKATNTPPHSDKSATLRILSIGRFSEQKNFDNLPFICSIMIEEMKKLLSIGRFCEAKNYDNVPDITRRIIEGGCDIKWYIIGYGGDEALIRQKITETGMQDHVIILGKKENPYPYIKGCDIYVQPSRYEGKSITVREAQMLCKPVVVTNYPTASSQIQDGVDGVIVPMDNEGCAKGLAEFILNSEKQSCIVEYLKTHDFSGQHEVNKLYKLIDV